MFSSNSHRLTIISLHASSLPAVVLLQNFGRYKLNISASARSMQQYPSKDTAVDMPRQIPHRLISTHNSSLLECTNSATDSSPPNLYALAEKTSKLSSKFGPILWEDDFCTVVSLLIYFRLTLLLLLLGCIRAIYTSRHICIALALTTLMLTISVRKPDNFAPPLFPVTHSRTFH